MSIADTKLSSLNGWFRWALGLAACMGLIAIAAGWRMNSPKKFGAIHSKDSLIMTVSAAEPQPALADGGRLPDLGGAVTWLNSAPLSSKSLRGKIVLVNFWTYSCINSLRELPYMKAWAAKYQDAGLVVIGVHTPEFSFEKEAPNVRHALLDLQVTYPVAVDSNYAIWQAFHNDYWPANYFIDGQGRIRHHHFGEGEYLESERVIQELLTENGATGLDKSPVRLSSGGVEAPPGGDVQSPETYAGYRQAERFASPERLEQDFAKPTAHQRARL
jgi:thiol-disulfide isomerase/thioredoxin